jgi:hypothetical protein
MKRNQIVAAMGFCAILCAVVAADIILPNYHTAWYCARIINVADFPDITVIGYIGPPTASANTRYIVNQDSCLLKGYKYSSYYFIWAPKHYVDSVGLDSLPLSTFVKGLAKKNGRASVQETSDLHLLSKAINTYGILVPDSIKLISEEFFYKLFPGNSNMYVYLWKTISHFSDSTSKVDTFAQPSGVRPSQIRVVPRYGVEDIFLKNGIFTFKAEFNGNLEMALIDCRGRIAQRYSKSCAFGRTYVSDLGKLTSGLYWLRLKSPNVDVTKRLTFIR